MEYAADVADACHERGIKAIAVTAGFMCPEPRAAGNVHDPEGGTTFCPGCGLGVVVRDWYHLSRYKLDGQGRCKSCGTAIPGVYAGVARQWGRRRLPIVIG